MARDRGTNSVSRRSFCSTFAALLAVYGCGQNEQPKKTVEAPARIPRIAMLYFSSTPFLGKAFRQRLSELGYVEGKTIAIEERFADGDAQQLAELARELAASKVTSSWLREAPQRSPRDRRRARSPSSW